MKKTNWVPKVKIILAFANLALSVYLMGQLITNLFGDPADATISTAGCFIIPSALTIAAWFSPLFMKIVYHDFRLAVVEINVITLFIFLLLAMA